MLIRHDFAPNNAANLFGLYGTASMVPMVALGGIALVWATWRPFRLHDRLIVLALGLLIAHVAVQPYLRTWGHPRPDTELAHITERWAPEGHDIAATFAAQFAGREHEVTSTEWRRLASFYFAEGRWQAGHEALERATQAAIWQYP